MPEDASVYKRKGRKVWYVSYWCAKRMKRVHVATRYSLDDPTAHKNAYRFAAAKSAEAQAFRGVSKLEVWGAWVVPYLKDRYRKQEKTLKRYIGAWDWILTYLEEREIVHPEALKYDHVVNFVSWRSKQRRNCGKYVSKNTALCDVKVLGIVMREAVRRGFANSNPCLQLGIQRDPSAEKSEFSNEEITLTRNFLAEKEADLPLQDRWMTIAFEIALHHGCRLSETQIPMHFIDLVRGTLKLTAKGRNGVAKIYSNRIHPGLLPLLTQLKATGTSVTCKHPPLNSKHFWHFFKVEHPELAHLTFHGTRVTVITRLARAGVPIQQAMAYVGHSSQTVHRIYQKLKAEDLSLCTQALSYSAPAQLAAHAADVDPSLAGGTGDMPQNSYASLAKL